MIIAVTGHVESDLFLQTELEEVTWTKVRKERNVSQTGGVVGCGVICSRSEECTLFRSDGDLCTLARVRRRSRTRELVE